FFFQAEDGIRDRNVTGVQTCALPISELRTARSESPQPQLRLLIPPVMPRVRAGTRHSCHIGGVAPVRRIKHHAGVHTNVWMPLRSEERRVGKEHRAVSGEESEKKKGI